MRPDQGDQTHPGRRIPGQPNGYTDPNGYARWWRAHNAGYHRAYSRWYDHYKKNGTPPTAAAIRAARDMALLSNPPASPRNDHGSCWFKRATPSAERPATPKDGIAPTTVAPTTTTTTVRAKQLHPCVRARAA